MSRIARCAVAAATLVTLCAPLAPAGAYTIPVGSGDWATMAFYEELPDGPFGMSLHLVAWGTEFHGGVPPEPVGGLGDTIACFAFDLNEVGGSGCADSGVFTIDRLQSASVSDTFTLELFDRHTGESLGPETATIALTLTGDGVLFPGARAQANPSPGAEAEVVLLRDATVSGTVESATLGTVDLGGRRAVIGHYQCVGFLAAEDPVESCRLPA